MIASDEAYGVLWVDVEHSARFQHLWATYAGKVPQVVVDAAAYRESATDAKGEIDAYLERVRLASLAKAAAEAAAKAAMEHVASTDPNTLWRAILEAKETNPYLMADLHEVQAVHQAVQQGQSFSKAKMSTPVPAFTMVRQGSGGLVPCKPGEMVIGMTVGPPREISHSEGVFTYEVQVVMK